MVILTVWLWASSFTPRSRRFLICEMGIRVSASQGSCEDEVK